MSTRVWELGIEADAKGDIPWIHYDGPNRFEAFIGDIGSGPKPDWNLVAGLTFTQMLEDHERRRGKKPKRADVYNLSRPNYVYTPRFVTVFAEHLKQLGIDLFEINCEGEKLFMFKNIPIVRAIDLERSQVEWYGPDHVKNVYNHVFFEDVVASHMFFRDQAECLDLFCNRQFFDIYHQAGLTGLKFEPLPRPPKPKPPPRIEPDDEPIEHLARELTPDESREIAASLKQYAVLARKHLARGFKGSPVEALSAVLDSLETKEFKNDDEAADVSIALAAAWLDILRKDFKWTAAMIQGQSEDGEDTLETLAAISPDRAHALLVGEYFIDRIALHEGENTVLLITNMIREGKLPPSAPERLMTLA